MLILGAAGSCAADTSIICDDLLLWSWPVVSVAALVGCIITSSRLTRYLRLSSLLINTEHLNFHCHWLLMCVA